jgi:hypothetical protein
MPGPINNSLATQIEPAEPVITYIGVPVVTVNVALCATHIPSNLNTFVGPGLAQNMLCPGTVSLGDEMGVGAASGINSGPDFAIAGNPQCMIGPAPVTSLATPHLQDLTNGAGMTLIPGQVSTNSGI